MLVKDMLIKLYAYSGSEEREIFIRIGGQHGGETGPKTEESNHSGLREGNEPLRASKLDKDNKGSRPQKHHRKLR